MNGFVTKLVPIESSQGLSIGAEFARNRPLSVTSKVMEIGEIKLVSQHRRIKRRELSRVDNLNKKTS